MGVYMGYIQKLSLFLVFFSMANELTAQLLAQQNLVFNNINKETGLPHNNVNCAISDHDGFLWIGTNSGLCRYDSPTSIKVYKPGDSKNPNALKSSLISDIHIDKEGILWIGTKLGGITKYDKKNNVWKTFTSDSLNINSLSNDEVLKVFEDSNDDLWIGTENGLNHFNKKTEKFTRFLPIDGDSTSLQSKAVLSIGEDKNGNIWVGTWAGGIHLLIPSKDGHIENATFRNFKPSEFVGSHNVWDIMIDSKGRYWLSTHKGGLFLMVVPESNDITNPSWYPKFIHYGVNETEIESLSSDVMRKMCEDRDGNIWIPSIYGLNIILKEELQFSLNYNNLIKPKFHFVKHYYNPTVTTSIADNAVLDVHEDKNGSIWMGTMSGLSQYSPYTNQFENYELYNEDSSSPNSQNIIVTGEDQVWIGNGDDGIFNYNFKSGDLDPVQEVNELLADNIISCVYSADGNMIYIATNVSVIVYNRLSKSSETYTIPKNISDKFGDQSVRCMMIDHESYIWLGTDVGLLKLNRTQNTYRLYEHEPYNDLSISNNTINQILQTEDKSIWLTTYSGLSKIIVNNNDKVEFKNFSSDNTKETIASNSLLSIAEKDGILYLGSTTGLLGYDYENDKFYNYSETDNKYFVQSIVTAKNGQIWASTTEGIFKFYPETKQIIAYQKKDGLAEHTFLHRAFYLDQEDNIYFGSRRGITKFNPGNLLSNSTPPTVKITESIISYNNITISHPYSFYDKLEVSHDHTSIEFHYAALNYTRAEKNQYAYKLEGFDSDWKYVDNNTPAVYTNLDHGAYTFLVKASNNDGVWNEQGDKLKLNITPAFWQTWWFILLSVLAFGGFILLGVRNYTKRINQRNQKLKEYNRNLNREIEKRRLIENELQTTNEELKRSNSELEQFAYIASHDLQEPLNITGNFIDILADRYQDNLDEQAFTFIEFAKGGVNRMGLLIKNLLTFSKVGGKVIAFKNASLQEIVEEKLLDLGMVIKKKNAEIVLDNLPEICCERFQIGMLFYNLINNALKFNDNEIPKIEITNLTSPKDTYWKFSVKDNGIGIEPEFQEQIFEIFKRLHNKDEYEGTGIGLALCKKIVNRHKGNIWLESKKGEGTNFVFTIDKNLHKENSKLNKPKIEHEQAAVLN